MVNIIRTRVEIINAEGNLIKVDETGQGKPNARARAVIVENHRNVRFGVGARPKIDIKSNGTTVEQEQPLRLNLTADNWVTLRIQPLFGKPYTAHIDRK